MYFYFLIALLVLCLFQDAKYRGIHWFVFPLLLAGSFTVNQMFLWESILFNFLFLSGMMVMLTLYLSVKEKKIVLITKGYFSLGDILFLLAVIPLFTFQEYILFFTAGTFIVLIIHFVINAIAKQKTIPYAGYMSIVTIGFLIFQSSIQSYLMQSWS